MPGFPLVVLALALTLAAPLTAQTVRGTLVDGAGQAVGGAAVALRDSAGATVARELTGADGRFVVRAPRPGRYTLAAERIGYAASVSPPLALSAGETLDYRMVATGSAVGLEGIVVTGRRRCAVRPEEGRAAARIWEEARKALDASAWTAERGLLRVTVAMHSRELEPERLRIRRETREVQRGVSRSPFVSRPAAELAETGYRERRADGTWFHAPDAEVLLSDEFLDTHCFRAVEGSGETRGMVGLAFEPVGRQRRTDVRGTLWLDRRTAELRHLEYGYTRLPRQEDRDGVGGRVEFVRLPGGAWIVSRWRIRMPELRVERWSNRYGSGEHAVLHALRERGGEVREVFDASGARLLDLGGGNLAATVVDAVTDAPLSGATVYLEGTEHRAATDSAGRASFAGLSEGVYALAFTHPRLDSLHHVPPAVEVRLRPGTAAEVRLLAPPAAAVLAEGCPEGAGGRTGVVAGTVRNDHSGAPLPGARAVFWWEGGWSEAVADGEGRYRVCNVPRGVEVSAKADFLGRSGEMRTFTVSGDEPHALDHTVYVISHSVRVGDRVVAATGNVPVRMELRVVDPETSAPVPGVKVRISGTRLRGTTDRRGRVLFPEVPHGSYRVELEDPRRGTHSEWLAVGGGEMEVTLRFPRPAPAQPAT